MQQIGRMLVQNSTEYKPNSLNFETLEYIPAHLITPPDKPRVFFTHLRFHHLPRQVRVIPPSRTAGKLSSRITQAFCLSSSEAISTLCEYCSTPGTSDINQWQKCPGVKQHKAISARSEQYVVTKMFFP